MGMTIAEAIQTLEYLRDSGVFPFSSKEGVLYTTESIDVAIDTVRKFKKIQEIYKKYLNDMVTNIYADGKFIVALRGILEDGKID